MSLFLLIRFMAIFTIATLSSSCWRIYDLKVRQIIMIMIIVITISRDIQAWRVWSESDLTISRVYFSIPGFAHSSVLSRLIINIHQFYRYVQVVLFGRLGLGCAWLGRCLQKDEVEEEGKCNDHVWCRDCTGRVEDNGEDNNGKRVERWASHCPRW